MTGHTNIFSDYFNPGDLWFWMLLPLTGPLWLFGIFANLVIEIFYSQPDPEEEA